MNKQVIQIPYIITISRFRKCLIYVNDASTKLLFKRKKILTTYKRTFPPLGESLLKFGGREYYNNTYLGECYRII